MHSNALLHGRINVMYNVTTFYMLYMYIQDGDTALHLGAKSGREGCVRLLLSTPGIDVNLKNKRGQPPLQLARDYNIVTMLQKYTTSCEAFPVHTYGKVIMCGDSGAGKSTLTKVRHISIWI